MRVVSVTMVNNECDIIELFIRINHRVIDEFFVIDNGSTDPTIEILLKLKREGFPITLWSYPVIDYQQEIVINSAMREIHQGKTFDYLIPLDADEFIDLPREDFHREIEALEGELGFLDVQNYVPMADEYFAHGNPLHRLFRKRNRESAFWKRILVPFAHCGTCLIVAGSHLACDANRIALPHRQTSLAVSHVPVRSSQQQLTKLIIASSKMRIKYREENTEGHYWKVFAEEVRKNGARLDYSMLLRFSLVYGLDEPATGYLEDQAIGKPEDRIIYQEESRINPDLRYWGFIDGLCQEIRRNRFPEEDPI